MINEFTGLYPVTKTLQFRLLPVGRTEENLRKDKVLECEYQRSNSVENVKKLMKNYHQAFISKSLEACRLDWTALEDAIMAFRADASKTDDLNMQLTAYREKLAAYFKSCDGYKHLATSGTLIKELARTAENDESAAAVKDLSGYTSLLFNFTAAMLKIYNSDDKANRIAHRLVNVNYMRFAANLCAAEEVYAILEEAGLIPDALTEVSEYAYKNAYNKCLTPEGIAAYNLSIGELNQALNELLQQQPQLAEAEPALKRKFLALYKLPMAEDAVSYDKFETYDEMKQAVSAFKELFGSIPASLIDVFSGRYDNGKIYIAGKELSRASVLIAGGQEWALIENALQDWYGRPYLKNGKLPSSSKNLVKRKMAQLAFSFKDIQTALSDFETSQYSLSVLFEKYNALYDAYITAENKLFFKEFDDKSILAVKNYLDSVNEIRRFLKIFDAPEIYAKDQGFYGIVDDISEKLADFVSLYNKVRNYLTKKPYGKEKLSLKFFSPAFGTGWDANKINQALTTIFVHDGKYYLGVVNKNDKPDFDALVAEKSDKPCYQRMVYKTFDIVKQLPRLSFTKAVKEHFAESDDDYILDGPNFVHPLPVPKEIYLQSFTENGDKLPDTAKKYGKAYLDMSGDYTGYYSAILKRIAFTRKFLAAYKSTAIYDLGFLKDDAEYQQWKDFTDDVQTALYKIRWESIPEDAINGLVESGKLYLFEIYSAGLSKADAKKSDVQAKLFKALFTDAGQKTVKLLGGCEVYFRPATLPVKVTHPKGSVLVNKHLINGKTMPEEVYREIYRYLNKKSGELSPLAKQLLDKELVKHRIAPYDIIKNKRFTEDQYSIHIPVAINYNSTKPHYLNMQVLDLIRRDSSVNILGINRGTRNLLYVTVINQRGEILYSRSLNDFDGIDYRDKLLVKEAAIKKAAANWQTIDSLKNLKEGYLSRAMGEIARLMIKFNAVCVLENLSSNFRNSGSGLLAKANLYKGFETSLIKKLNCLILNGQCAADEEITGLQMTRSFETLEKAGRQSGWVFMLDPAYISSVDPVTGFANLFSFRKVTTIRQKAEFLSKFKSIAYLREMDAFDFAFDYGDFGINYCGPVSCWIASSDVERIERVTSCGKTSFEYVLPTLLLKKLFEENNVDYKTGKNLIDVITSDSQLTAGVFKVLQSILRMYNYDRDKDNDFVSSPVMGRFDTRNDGKLHNPDELAAYNMARKGLMIFKRAQASEPGSKVDFFIRNDDWFRYLQTGTI